nr:hypothetical protein [Tanacetum cinerariifolium]
MEFRDKNTKADLEGPAFRLIGRIQEGDYCSYNLSKPLPLQGPLGRKTIPVDFFLNQDLENLKTGNKDKKYVVSLSKPKAARARHARTSTHEVYSRMKILRFIIIMIDKQIGYGYLKEIMVRRVHQQEYKFNEADFKRLHLNDIEDMLLLIVLKKRIEGVQLGVESYQTKLNITMPQVRCAGIDVKEPYTIL